MTIQEAHVIQKHLKNSPYFRVTRINTGLPKSHGLIIQEMKNRNLSTTLTRYSYIEAICKIFECGMLIETIGSTPNYYLY